MIAKPIATPPKRRDIAASLRAEIVAGRLAPGMQMPSRADIITRFGSTAATVQHAMDLLLREGSIRINGRQATYVAEYPPHLFEHAMVFTSLPEQKPWNRFFRMLATEAQRYRGTPEEPRRISLHYGVDAHADNLEGRKLASAVQARSLAGMILPENPFGTGLADAPCCRLPGVPRVAFAAVPPSDNPALWGSISLASFHGKALDELARQGCRRIAVLYGHPCVPGTAERYAQAIAERGMRTQAFWLQSIPYQGPECGRQLVHLLFHPGQKERPDGLLIADDNLVEEALGGVVEAGVRVPSELRIVTHCNFPWPLASVVPVCRIGYPSAALVAACLDELAAQRAGAAPSTRTVEAVFESEL
jgi:DNA-binding LacI/PurR family transcriptional regulator